MEIKAVDRLKKILEDYLEEETREFKNDLYLNFNGVDKVLECFDDLFNDLESSVIDNYSMSFEDD